MSTNNLQDKQAQTQQVASLNELLSSGKLPELFDELDKTRAKAEKIQEVQDTYTAPLLMKYTTFKGVKSVDELHLLAHSEELAADIDDFFETLAELDASHFRDMKLPRGTCPYMVTMVNVRGIMQEIATLMLPVVGQTSLQLIKDDKVLNELVDKARGFVR